MLWAKGGAELHVGQGGEGVEAVGEVAGDRGGVRQQGHTSAGQRRAQGGVGKESVKAKSDRHVACGGVQRVGGIHRQARAAGW